MMLLGCAGGTGAPSGPPPEYEPPSVLPWDAGAPPPGSDQPFVDELERESGALAADAAVAPTDAALGDSR
jgi:hypothetical protein